MSDHEQQQGQEADDAPLTADEILRFGPAVEAQVWTPAFIAEERAPIARAAGRPRFGRVFNEEGVGKAVLIRPCMSRGRRIRGLRPIYTPRMLEAHADVFTGWPMFLDHRLDEQGRSVKDLGGQVITSSWDPMLRLDEDEEYGYQRGGVVAEIWATPLVRSLVDNNPDVLHTSISAWPTGGRPGTAPWNPRQRGMVIEGIRRQPQGSVDFVPRGGAGGRLRPLGEAADPDEREWPQAEWTEEARELVVSAARESYDHRDMADAIQITSRTTPEELRRLLQESGFTHLLPAVEQAPAADSSAGSASADPVLTEEQVQRIVERYVSEHVERKPLDPQEIEQRMRESVAEAISELAAQQALSERAIALIDAADGIPSGWKADLRERYTITPSGPALGVLVEEEDLVGEDGTERTPQEVVEARVKEDLRRVRARLAEAQGKPVIKGEGGGTAANAGVDRVERKAQKMPEWRSILAQEGVVEGVDKALMIHGVETTEDQGAGA